MKKDSNFNIFNEKENKIEYCFSKLLYYAEYIKFHPKYKYINNEIFIILTDIKKWLKIYIKCKSLKYINIDEIDKILKIMDNLIKNENINNESEEILELYICLKDLIILKTI